MIEKTQITAHFDRIAPVRDKWIKRNSYYHETLRWICRKQIPPGKSVLELGCASGELLAAMSPALGVGVDLSREMVLQARSKYPKLNFFVGDAEAIPLKNKFEFIILSDLLGHLHDIQLTLEKIRVHTLPSTKVIITYFNFLWHPVLEFGERVGLKMPEQQQNWLGRSDIRNILELTDYEVVEEGVKLVLPRRIPFFANWMNEKLIRFSWARHLALMQFFVAQQLPETPMQEKLTCSVIIPCRNERDNVADAVERMPKMGAHTELIFVDGQSTDGTVEEIERHIERCKGTKDIRLIHQVQKKTNLVPGNETPANLMLKLGKGDAVRKGFSAAKGDILMILDADLTVAPEDLPKFFKAITQGKGRFINGTRLVYPMEGKSMKFFNMVGNKFFSWVFTWLLNQRIKDTLCGTKVLFKSDYEKIVEGRSYFGDFDPFGDFDLLFGAARLGIPITELPIRYRSRIYGDSKVRVFKHGILLLKMSFIAFQKFKWSIWFMDIDAGSVYEKMAASQPTAEREEKTHNTTQIKRN